MGRALLIACVAAWPVGGCLPTPTFHCADDFKCGENGTCEPDGLCSFPDTTCASGQRYGELSGDESNQCVAATDVASCAGYAPLAGVGGKQYLTLSGDDTWSRSAATCAATGGLLAVPQTRDEADAVLGAKGLPTWLGIEEHGAAFEAATGEPVTFLPWQSGQPSGAGDATCVVADAGDGGYALEACTDVRAAVCECAGSPRAGEGSST